MNTYPIPHLDYSQHAVLRTAQRNLSRKDVEFIVSHGTEYRRAGAIHYYLRQCDVPYEQLAIQEISRLIGSTVVVSTDDNRVITTYRDYGKGPRHITRKATYRYRKHNQ